MRRTSERIGLDECRRLLGEGCRLSDEQLLKVRDQLYEVARVVAAAFVDDAAYSGGAVRPPDAADLEEIDERAAIMEFDGKLPRQAAERLARLQSKRISN